MSFGLAALFCLQCFAFSAAEDEMPEPQPTAYQETAAPEPEPTPISFEPAETLAPAETPAPSIGPENPEQEPEGTPEPEATPEPETTIAPEETIEPEETIAPEVTIDPEETPEPEGTLNPETTPEATRAPEYVCGLPEHVHGEECYDEGQNLTCTLEAHIHDAGCLPAETPAPAEEDQSAEDVPDPGDLIIAPRVDEALWRGVKPSDERGMAIPMLFQGDYAQIVCSINGRDRSVATSGCGATSLSMVIAYLTGNTDQTPYNLFCDSVEAGRYHGAGWSHSTLSSYAEHYGVSSRWIHNDAETILRALREGRPVIAHMGPGIFTSRGHYLVLRGVTEEGLVLMNDPNSHSNCEMAFPIGTLLKQAKTDEAFMVCWNNDMPAFEVHEAKQESTETLRGDINDSGSVDINDAQLLYSLLSEGAADERYDVNGDGAVDQTDLDALMDMILNPKSAEGGDKV